MATVKSFKADVWSVSPSSERMTKLNDNHIDNEGIVIEDNVIDIDDDNDDDDEYNDNEDDEDDCDGEEPIDRHAIQ